MNQQRQFAIVVAMAAVLAVVCLIQAVIIAQARSDAATQMDASGGDLDSLSSHLFDKFSKDLKERDDLFDGFFDDGFFSRRDDPFAEMKRMRERLEERMSGDLDAAFNQSWEGWFGNRFFAGSTGIKVEQEDGSEKYVITVRIPDGQENRLNVEVDANGVTIAGKLSQVAEHKDSEGNVVARNEVSRSISEHLPLPIGADHTRARIDTSDDTIVVTIPKATS